MLICLKVMRSKVKTTEKKLHFEMTDAREGYDQVEQISRADANVSISMQQNNSTYEEVQQ